MCSTAGLFTSAIHLLTVIVWLGCSARSGCRPCWSWCKARKACGSLPKGKWGWLSAFFSGAGMLCDIAALRETSIAHVATIHAVVLFVTADLGWAMLSERPSRDPVVARWQLFWVPSK
ncbi:MAG: hypothetical protein H7245_03615 [Candidatus Saccharibacteria bacterium]|nr:hypothetical protein [Pseudorhodobacter sp.]